MFSKLSTSSSNAISQKRKHNSLTIAKKVELLKKLEKGASVLQLCNEYGVGKSTVYDLQKQKAKLLQFFSDSDTPLAMNKRKTIRPSNNEDIDKIMIEWVRQRRSENVPLTGAMITAQARIFHAEMKIESPCEYSSGWLEKFKKRHGIRQLRICGEKEGADVEAAEFFVDAFCQRVADENLSLEQIYNADETSLFWRYVPKKTLATAEEKNPAGVKESKERLTVLACANAAGTHKCKLLLIGKHARPRALKNVKSLPTIYKANKRAWVTQELFIDWFNNNFIPEARAHAKLTGLSEDSKILLIIDNCSAHPSAEILNKDNFEVLFLPPNCTSLIQPMDQGILRALKCRYKNDFLHRMLHFVNKEKSILEFIKQFSIKDAIWCAANAWQNINKDILRHAWRNLMPTIIFFDDEDDEEEFEGFSGSKDTEMISGLLSYCKENTPGILLTTEDVNEVFHADDESPIVNKLTDEEIRRMALDELSESEESESDDVQLESKMPIDDIVENLDKAIKGIEQRDFISEQEIMSLYKIKEKLIYHKRNSMRQLSIKDMFKKKDNISQ